MRGKTNYWRIGQNCDEDLWFEKLISSWDSKGLRQASETPGQCVEHLVEHHLSRAVILEHKTISPVVVEYQEKDIEMMKKIQRPLETFD